MFVYMSRIVKYYIVLERGKLSLFPNPSKFILTYIGYPEVVMSIYAYI